MPSDIFEFAALNEAVNYRRALLTEFAPYLLGDVLEVGAGIGQFTTELVACPGINRVHAVEPDAGYFNALRQRNLPIAATHGTIDSLPEAPAYDCIVSINVLEHIEDDAPELKRYRQRLRPGGHLCLFVPACPALYAPIEQGFGHFRRYRLAALRGLLQAAGFQIDRLHYYNSLGFFAWWVNFCLLKQMKFDAAKVRFHDRYLFPWVHTFESKLMRPPLGQSLMAIARV